MAQHGAVEHDEDLAAAHIVDHLLCELDHRVHLDLVVLDEVGELGFIRNLLNF